MPRMLKEHEDQETHSKWPIAVIILAALAIRLTGIGYGLPYAFNEDEERVVRQGFRLTNVSWQPAAFDKPVFMNYIAAGEYGAFYGLGHLTKKFGPVHEFETYYRSDPSSFIILARLTSVVFGLLSIYVVYLLGKGVFEWSAGLVAAVILAFVPQHVRFSVTGSGDALAFFFFVSGLYLFLKLAAHKQLVHAFAGALLFGLAAAAQYQYAVLAVLALALYLAVVPREYKVSAFIAGLPVMAVLFAVAAIAPNGTLLMSPRIAWWGFTSTFLSQAGFNALQRPEVAVEPLKALVARDIFTSALGWGLVGAGTLGIVWGLLTAKWKRTLFLMLLAAVVLCGALFFPLDGESFQRWGMLLAAPLAVGAGSILYRMFWRRGIPAVVGAILMIIFAAAIAAQPAAQAGVMSVRKSADDTRWQYAKWAQSQLPDGAAVLATPQARFLLDERTLRGGAGWEAERADVLSHWGGRSFLVTVVPVPPVGVVAPELKGFDYVIVDSWSVDRLKKLDTYSARAFVDIITAARAQGRVVKSLEALGAGLKGFGPAIEVIELPKAGPTTPTKRP